MKKIYCIKNCGREKCNPLYVLRMPIADGYELEYVNQVKDLPKNLEGIRCPGYFYGGKGK